MTAMMSSAEAFFVFSTAVSRSAESRHLGRRSFAQSPAGSIPPRPANRQALRWLFKLLNMSSSIAGASDIAGPAGQTTAERWAVTGGYDVSVFYKDRDWVSIAFDAGGEEAIYVPDSLNPQFMPVWNA